MEIYKTDVFDKWLKKLKDRRAKNIIQVHIDHLVEGKLGKLKSVGGKVHEKKINYGPGYRLYLIHQNKQIIILLCAGDKSTQQSDILQARVIAMNIKLETKGNYENIKI